LDNRRAALEKRLIGHNDELEDSIIKKYIELRQKKVVAVFVNHISPMK